MRRCTHLVLPGVRRSPASDPAAAGAVRLQERSDSPPVLGTETDDGNQQNRGYDHLPNYFRFLFCDCAGLGQQSHGVGWKSEIFRGRAMGVESD